MGFFLRFFNDFKKGKPHDATRSILRSSFSFPKKLFLLYGCLAYGPVYFMTIQFFTVYEDTHDPCIAVS
jgi:hypothetical protein